MNYTDVPKAFHRPTAAKETILNTQQTGTKVDSRSKVAREARRTWPKPSEVILSHSSLDAKEDQIRANYRALKEAQIEAAMAQAKEAARWLSTNRPDVTLGVAPTLMLVADGHTFTLPELDGYGRSGNAIMLSDGPFGQLWWCDPEGRPTMLHECLLYARKVTPLAAARTVGIRFCRSVESQ